MSWLLLNLQILILRSATLVLPRNESRQHCAGAGSKLEGYELYVLAPDRAVVGIKWYNVLSANTQGAAAAAAKSLQSCPTLCDPRDGSPPGSAVPGILQARTLEWVAISFSKAWVKNESEVAQSFPTLSDPMDCSLPGSSIHGIFQARVLEWGAIPQSWTCLIIY